jgi:hypothetical protein
MEEDCREAINVCQYNIKHDPPAIYATSVQASMNTNYVLSENVPEGDI